MTKEQEALLLTVARLLCSHLNDHLICAHDGNTMMDLKCDIAVMNKALAPFDGSINDCITLRKNRKRCY